jgi:hypothetical protein
MAPHNVEIEEQTKVMCGYLMRNIGNESHEQMENQRK